MDDAGAEVAAGGRERLEPVKQRVDKRAAAARVLTLPRAGVNHHSSRLVHDSQVGILEDYVQGNVFGGCFERRGMRLARRDAEARRKQREKQASRFPRGLLSEQAEN